MKFEIKEVSGEFSEYAKERFAYRLAKFALSPRPFNPYLGDWIIFTGDDPDHPTQVTVVRVE